MRNPYGPNKDACPFCHKRVRVSTRGLLYKHYVRSGSVASARQDILQICQGSYSTCSQDKGTQEKMLSLRTVIEEAIRRRIEQVEKRYA